MTDWTGADYLNELRGRPAARSPASVGEIWDAEWTRAGLDTVTGIGRPYGDAVRDLEGAIAEASGQDLTEYAFSQGVNLAGAASRDQRVKLLAQLADTLPDDARKAIEPLKDVRRRAAEKAQKIEADASDVAASTYGLSGTATAFLAGIARQTVDPINLGAMIATAPIGGPLEGAAVKVIARQAGAGGAAQAVVEPYIEPARGELGLDHGGKRALANIAGAAAGGAGISAGLLGLGALFRVAGRRMRIAERGDTAPIADHAAAESDFFNGYVTADDIAALDRGEISATYHARGLGAGAADAPSFGEFDVTDAAQARPTGKRLAEAPPERDVGRFTERTFAGYLHADDHGLDIGGRLPAEPDHVYVGSQGQFDLGWNFNVSSGDLLAAARLAERDAVFDTLAGGGKSDARGRAETLDATARAMEDGRPLSDIPESEIVTTHVTQQRGGQARYRAHSLLEFMAGNGGLNAKDPLAADVLQSFGGQNPFIPGFGRLIRKDVKPLDSHMEAAIEAGYFVDPAREAGGASDLASSRDLLNAIDDEARGNRLYPAGAENTKTKAELAAFRESDRVARETARADNEAHFDARMVELQIKPLKKLRNRSLEIMEREAEKDPLLAYERALIEYEDAQDAIRQVRYAEPELHIPGWDVVDDAGAAPPNGAAAARARERSAGGDGSGGPTRPDGGGAGEAPAEPKLAGDPALKAEADRALDAQGGDVEISLPDENGGVRKVSARQALREAEDDARAADEFKKCVGDQGEPK